MGLRISVIDLGFNSLKLVSYDVKQDNSSFTAFYQRSIVARLGEGLNQTGFLGDEPIRRSIDGLKFFKELNEFNGVRYCLPIATSAVREAANRDQFLRRVVTETGLRLRVLSGREEALYSFFGAAKALGLSDALFFDIGGGSVEFVSCRDSKVRRILSLPLGGLRLTQLYSESDGSFKEKAYFAMKERIVELLPSRAELNLDDRAALVGVGGNLRALARWDQEIRGYPFNKLHNYSMKRASVKMMTEELSTLSGQEIGDIYAIGRSRAETILAGALVVELTMRKLGFQRVTVSTHGLRDGILASFLDDPLAFHENRRSKSLRLNQRARESAIAPSVRRFVGKLEEAGFLEADESRILAYELRWVTTEAPPTIRPEALFYQIMDEDSPLSHREQLLAALSFAELRKPRSAEWLFSTYKSMLKPKKSKETIEKIAALSRFLEIVVKTESRLRFSLDSRDRRIKLRILPGKQEFPGSLLKASLADMGNRLDRFVEYSVKSAPAIPKGAREQAVEA